jgi:ketosteroid isomerase-like protein
MAEHPNATVYRTALEKFNAGDMSATDLIADDVVWYQIGAEPLRGKEAMLQSMEGLKDLEFDIEIHDITASDDHVVGLITATVRTEDDTFSYRTAEIAHVKDGKITERWAFSDDTEAIIRFFEGLG